MTKEEKIKEAYGDAWEALSPYIDINGWVRAYNLHKYDTLPLAFKVETIVMDGVDWYRPLELKGINDNNGWTKIDSENDLPKSGNYTVISTSYNVPITAKFAGTAKTWIPVGEKDRRLISVTHWRPIVEIPKPLY